MSSIVKYQKVGQIRFEGTMAGGISHLCSTESISQFYSGRTLFLTGGSGFLGKQIIEKLLRSCPAVDQILVLIRTKKNKSPDERLDQLFDSPVFDRLKLEQPDFRRKVSAVSGDILLPGLGISDKDRSRIESNASVFIHSAASINFTEPIRNAVEANIKPVKKMLELARASKSVEAFVHISTAYSQVDKKEIDEIIYEPPIDPYRLMNMIEVCDDEQLALLAPKLLASRPNIYTFTKAVAEKLVDLERGDLPVAIVRPTIVCASHKEPFEGWVDNYTACSGILSGCGLGTIRHMTGRSEAFVDFIPIDLTCNAILAAGRHVAINRNQDSIFVLNYASSALHPLEVGRVCEYITKNSTIYSTPKYMGLLPPYLAINGNWLARNLSVYFFLPLRAQILDFLAKVTGEKPRAVKTQQQFTHLQKVLEYFTTNDFHFESKNVGVMLQELSPEDNEKFNFDIRTVEWESYHLNYWLGLKQYLLKEELESVETLKPETATI